MHIEFEHKTLKSSLELDVDLSKAQEDQLLQLNALDEYQNFSLHNIELSQQQWKKWHDKFIHNNKFSIGD